MRFIKTATVNASVDAVWKVFAHDFDHAYRWMASVPQSYAQDNGPQFVGAQSVGRVCELSPSPSGLKVSERFLDYDEDSKTCTVRIDFLNTGAIFPVVHNTVEFAVVEAGPDQSEMTWAFRSKIKPWAFVLWPLIRVAFSIFVGQIIQELKFFVENGTPHPRKLKAIKAAH